MYYYIRQATRLGRRKNIIHLLIYPHLLKHHLTLFYLHTLGHKFSQKYVQLFTQLPSKIQLRSSCSPNEIQAITDEFNKNLHKATLHRKTRFKKYSLKDIKKIDPKIREMHDELVRHRKKRRLTMDQKETSLTSKNLAPNNQMKAKGMENFDEISKMSDDCKIRLKRMYTLKML